MTLEQFAAECLTRQLDYIATERARFTQARAQLVAGQPITDSGLAISNRIQALQVSELDDRLLQLAQMEIDAPVQFAADSDSVKISYELSQLLGLCFVGD